MDLVVPRKCLLPMVERAARVAKSAAKEGRDGSIVLEAEGNTFRASATASEWGVSGQTYAEVDSDDSAASVAVPGAALLLALRQIDDGPVRVTSSGSDVEVRALGRSRWAKLAARKATADDATPLPPSDAPSIAIHLGALSGALDWTRKTISSDETRPHINAVRLSAKGGRLTAVSTDGHRLNVAEVDAPGTGDIEPTLLPRGAALALCRTLRPLRWDEEAPATVRLHLAEGRAWFAVDGTVVWAKLVDATFPNYASVVPKDRACEARVPLGPLRSFLCAADVVAAGRRREDGGPTRVILFLSPGRLRLEAGPSGGGWTLSDDVPVSYTGPPKTESVNLGYLLDALDGQAWDGGGDALVSFQPQDLSPVVVRPEAASHGCDYTAIVMPVRV